MILGDDLTHQPDFVMDLADKILDTVREPLLVIDSDHRVLWANQAFHQHFTQETVDLKQRCIYELDAGRWNVAPLQELIHEVLEKGVEKRDVEISCAKDEQSNAHILLVNAKRLMRAEGASPVVVVGIEDITVQRYTERELSDYRAHLENKVRQRTLELEKANRQLQRLATVDQLTGLANRHLFNRTMEHEWARARREKKQLSMLLIDIDHFKLYNDAYGHQRGDECLYQVANCLTANLARTSDFVARYGGEEFITILPDTPLAGAARLAEKLRNAVEALHLAAGDPSISQWVTISIGAATCLPDRNRSYADLIKGADKALYAAKNSGRNKVMLAGDIGSIAPSDRSTHSIEEERRKGHERRKSAMHH